MPSMSRVERFIERLVERPSARLFRTRLQPVQILRRIERAMEAGRGAEGQRDLVPDVFTVRLHPRDLAALAGPDGADPERVAANLASAALTFAREHRYAVRGRPRVALRAEPGLEAGEIEVVATVSGPPAGDAASEAADGRTRVYDVPVVQAPEAVIDVDEPGRSRRRVPISGAPLLIGRAPECGLVLKDTEASRRHARLQARGGVLVLTDLGSTNGTRVNGHRITEVVLGVGDRIQVGQTSIVVGTTSGAITGTGAISGTGARP
jgi:hypothetical protein